MLEGDLTGEDGGAALIANVDDLEQISPVGVGHGAMARSSRMRSSVLARTFMSLG
jgi:hypothetical protein